MDMGMEGDMAYTNKGDVDGGGRRYIARQESCIGIVVVWVWAV